MFDHHSLASVGAYSGLAEAQLSGYPVEVSSKALAVTASTRHPTFPNVPTMSESGVKDFEFTSWWAAWVPKGTPQEIVDKLEGWFGHIMALEETREFLAPVAGTPLKGGSKEAREKQRVEILKWKRATEAAGIKPL